MEKHLLKNSGKRSIQKIKSAIAILFVLDISIK